MAEVVAASLRDRILRGDITEVPRLEVLTAEFDAGPPAVREALRILETEGLVTVRRGNVGGADVHPPTPERVAYMAGMVLKSKAVDVGDVGAALQQLEALCTAMCAARADRLQVIVPHLRAIVAEQVDALGDGPRTREVIDRFHRALVDGCGNETLVLVVGALQHLWAASHGTDVDDLDGELKPDLALWQASVRDHERLIDAVELGDPGTFAIALGHLVATRTYPLEFGSGSGTPARWPKGAAT